MRLHSIDTRTLRPGETYVAIRGEAHDGHDFVAEAVAAGANSVVVDHAGAAALGDELPVEIIIVDDTVAYLTEGAAAKVARSGADVIAITGSVGKTGTRAAVVAVLSQQFPVVAATGNLNTPLGLALTVLNAEFDEDTKLVMEMGARLPGDLAEMTQLFPPRIAVVTNVKGVHLETFGSIEAIEQEKGSLVAALDSTGTAVLNVDDPRVAAMAGRTDATVLRVGVDTDGASIDVGPELVATELPLLGEHALITALMAAGVGVALGMDRETINAGLAVIRPERGRLVRLPGRNSSTLIDDSYNASPDATMAALDVLAGLPALRRWAFLGDMLELGHEEEEGHRRVVEAAVAIADRVILVGPRMAAAAAELDTSRRAGVITVATAAEVAEALDDEPEEGDVALSKGSQGMRMERVSAWLLDPVVNPIDVLCRQNPAWTTP